MIENLLIRKATAEDLPFIYSTWLRSYKYSSTGFTQPINKEIYYEFHSLVIKRIIDRGASILVAADRQEPKVIYGYLVWEPFQGFDLVHYVYIKKAFRKLGIGTALFNNLDIGALKYTHHTEDCKKILNKKEELGWQTEYNPYLL